MTSNEKRTGAPASALEPIRCADCGYAVAPGEQMLVRDIGEDIGTAIHPTEAACFEATVRWLGTLHAAEQAAFGRVARLWCYGPQESTP